MAKKEEPVTVPPVTSSNQRGPHTVTANYFTVGADGNPTTSFSPTTKLLLTASSLANIYHGYKRNNSVLWALIWGLTGPIGNVVSIAQGYGKPKGK